VRFVLSRAAGGKRDVDGLAIGAREGAQPRSPERSVGGGAADGCCWEAAPRVPSTPPHHYLRITASS
jgi:hypothetical protein